MLVDSRGVAVNLGSHLGGGAEGDVYEVSRPGLVAKVLHPPSRTPERRAKLRIMVVRMPKDPTAALGHPTLCWPRELLLKRSELVGFLMPRLDVRTCLPLHRFMFPQLYPALFHWGLQLEIAANLAAGLAAVHAEGYVVGDLNFRNVYVTQRCLITFLDCDSMQVTDPASGRVLRCPVGMPEYIAPELRGVALDRVNRTEASDSFAFAVMICQLLLTGTHPFAGGLGPTREDNILDNDCFLLNGNAPRGSPSPAILPPPLLDLLVRCFRDGYRSPPARPKLHELAHVLAIGRRQVSACSAFPMHHVFGSHLASCPWCDQLRRRIDSYRAGAVRAGGAPVGGARVGAHLAAARAGQATAAGTATAGATATGTAAAATAAVGGQALPPIGWVPRPAGGPRPGYPRRPPALLLFVLVGVASLVQLALVLTFVGAITQREPSTAAPSGGTSAAPSGGTSPAFAFTFAEPDPHRGREVTTVRPVDLHPVSERSFQSCVNAGWCDASPERESCLGGWTPAPDAPAVCVSWNDAAAFCKRQSKNLPTRYEWVGSRLAGAARGAPREWVKEGMTTDGGEGTDGATAVSVTHDDRRSDLGFRCASH